MPALFGTLTAIVLALSTWIAYKNRVEYEKQIAFRQTEEKNYAKEVKDFDRTTEAWKLAIADKEAFIEENTTLSAEIKSLEGDIESLVAEVEQKESDKNRLQQEIDTANTAMDKVGGARALVPKVKGLRDDVAALELAIEDGNAQLSNLKQTKADTEAVIKVNEKRVENETAGRSQPSLSTTIKTVYSSWGFVTLNGGDIQGVVPGSTLEVIRGGEAVAKLKVTTVEENRAAADIVRESVGPDVYLRPGDQVKAVASTKTTEEAKKSQPAEVTAN